MVKGYEKHRKNKNYRITGLQDYSESCSGSGSGLVARLGSVAGVERKLRFRKSSIRVINGFIEFIISLKLLFISAALISGAALLVAVAMNVFMIGVPLVIMLVKLFRISLIASLSDE